MTAALQTVQTANLVTVSIHDRALQFKVLVADVVASQVFIFAAAYKSFSTDGSKTGYSVHMRRLEFFFMFNHRV
jgi:hypothetical protein